MEGPDIIRPAVQTCAPHPMQSMPANEGPDSIRPLQRAGNDNQAYFTPSSNVRGSDSATIVIALAGQSCGHRPQPSQASTGML